MNGVIELKAIFFDFDGVLTTDPYGSDSFMRYFTEHTSVSPDFLRHAYYKYNKGLLYGDYTHGDIWDDFCQTVGEQLDYQLLIKSFRSTPLDFEMISFVRELKKEYRIGLITDNKADRIEEILNYHSLSGLFDTVIVSAACKCGKTDKKIFELALNSLHVRAKDCIFIDNSHKNLVVPAEMGIHTILFDDQVRDHSGFRKSLFDILSVNPL